MSTRPDEPRIQPVDEISEELAEVLAGALMIDGRPLNIFGVLGHHPKMLKRFNLFAGFLLNKGVIPPREREIVILRVGWNAKAVYEFGQHTVIGRDCGLTDAEIRSLAGRLDEHDWSADDLALIQLADDLHADDCVTDQTWARLGTRWNDQELVELLIVAGAYRMVSGFLNSTGVPLDDSVPGFPV